jgi:hypothetical protein
MITIAVFALIAFHPGFGFQNKFNTMNYQAKQGADGGKEMVSLTVTEDVPCLQQRNVTMV